MSYTFDIETFKDPIFNRILGVEEDGAITDWYALLGVDRFESDEAVLDKAMLRRFEAARRYQVGNYELQASKLIEELGRAYTCLTSDEDRHAYDQSLAGDSSEQQTSVSESQTTVDTSQVVEAEVVSEVAASPVDENVCPKCGNATSPKAAVCYHCGFKKAIVPAVRDRTGKKSGSKSDAVPVPATSELVRQDFTPEQLLARVKEMRKMNVASKLATGHWRAPQKSSRNKFSAEEASSRCRNCGRGLMHESDAFGIAESEVRRTKDFVQSFARKLESLGQANFDWPLSDDSVAMIQQRLSSRPSDAILLYCRGCAQRIVRSLIASA